MNIKLIWVNGTLDHGLSEAVARGDEHHLIKTRFSVDGKHHTGYAQVRAHHALNAGTQRHIMVGIALVHPVADGPVVVEGGKHFANLVQDIVNAQHVEKSFLLPGKRGIGQIFRRGGRAHRKRCLFCTAMQDFKGPADRLLQVGRKRLRFDHGANIGSSLGECAHIVGIQARQARLDAGIKTGRGQKVPKRTGGSGKTSGHFDPGRQLGNHFAQAGVFAAHLLDVAHSQMFKRDDHGGRAEECRHEKTPEVEIGAPGPISAADRLRAAMSRVCMRACLARSVLDMVEFGRCATHCRGRSRRQSTTIPASKPAQKNQTGSNQRLQSIMPNRTVFFISDGTGITAETFGRAILAQFETKFRQVRMPFMDSVDKAHQAVRQINHALVVDGKKPIVFTTLVNAEILQVIRDGCQGMLLDMFGTFVQPLEAELQATSNHRIGRFSDASKSKEYQSRIEAINFSLAHDDGQSNLDLEQSDVILVGVSRSGKTPTSLYLAMQYGLKASNYPLIPEDFERQHLPIVLKTHQSKLFGLTIQAERLSDIRKERRPNSIYASLENCRMEVREAESMMRRSGIRWLSTTTKSIEEIATTILQEIHPERLNFE